MKTIPNGADPKSYAFVEVEGVEVEVYVKDGKVIVKSKRLGHIGSRTVSYVIADETTGNKVSEGEVK